MSHEGKCCSQCPCPCNDPTRAENQNQTSRIEGQGSTTAQRPAKDPSGNDSAGSECIDSWSHFPPNAAPTSQLTNQRTNQLTNQRTNQRSSHCNSIRQSETGSSMDSGVRETLQMNELLLLKRKLQVLETRLQVLETHLASFMQRHRRLNLLRGNVLTAVNHEFDAFSPI